MLIFERIVLLKNLLRIMAIFEKVYEPVDYFLLTLHLFYDCTLSTIFFKKFWNFPLAELQLKMSNFWFAYIVFDCFCVVFWADKSDILF